MGACMALLSIVLFTGGKAEAAPQCGKASWYSTEDGFNTASGDRLSPAGMTAAHRTLPFGTNVRVDNLANGRSVVVRINDRGPFVGGRVIDVNKAAAQILGLISSGVARVKLTVLDGAAALSGNGC